MPNPEFGPNWPNRREPTSPAEPTGITKFAARLVIAAAALTEQQPARVDEATVDSPALEPAAEPAEPLAIEAPQGDQ